jgi:uncharacterized repeat protein (TIGR03809 family)
MTYRNDAAHPDVLGRWRMLAEQRLEYLTHLFESGRWRRYYGELAFLENIREAKVAVETWRGLSTADAMPEHPVMRVTWPDAKAPPRPRATSRAPAIAVPPVEVPVAAEPDPVAANNAPATVDMLALEQALDTVEQVLDVGAIEQRYPLLRNTL